MQMNRAKEGTTNGELTKCVRKSVQERCSNSYSLIIFKVANDTLSPLFPSAKMDHFRIGSMSMCAFFAFSLFSSKLFSEEKKIIGKRINSVYCHRPASPEDMFSVRSTRSSFRSFYFYRSRLFWSHKVLTISRCSLPVCSCARVYMCFTFDFVAFLRLFLFAFYLFLPTFLCFHLHTRARCASVALQSHPVAKQSIIK